MREHEIRAAAADITIHGQCAHLPLNAAHAITRFLACHNGYQRARIIIQNQLVRGAARLAGKSNDGRLSLRDTGDCQHQTEKAKARHC